MNFLNSLAILGSLSDLPMPGDLVGEDPNWPERKCVSVLHGPSKSKKERNIRKRAKASRKRNRKR